MKTKSQLALIVLALIASVHQAIGQLPVISSFGQNGGLVCTNLQPGTTARVEWAASLSGPWQTNWASLAAVTADSNGTISVSVPMFYRVCGVPWTTTSDGMALIPAGTFTMGDTLDGESDAIPTNIYVSAFYMDTNLVSLGQWQTVFAYATNHGYGFLSWSGKAADNPVQLVDWYSCVKWCNARSQQAGLTPVYYADAGLTQVFTNGDGAAAVYANWTAKGYRLPTEAEWEKAARGGLSGQRFPWGNTISESQANYSSYFSLVFNPAYDLGPYSGYNTTFDTGVGTEPFTSPAGYFGANGYGLNDMAGNVWEWCWDWYGAAYGQPTNTNPTGPGTPGPGSYRMMRGGSWEAGASNSRCAARVSYAPADFVYDIGFRCVRGF